MHFLLVHQFALSMSLFINSLISNNFFRSLISFFFDLKQHTALSNDKGVALAEKTSTEGFFVSL